MLFELSGAARSPVRRERRLQPWALVAIVILAGSWAYAPSFSGVLTLDDIRGIAVHIGARVSALAGPNEVLVSSTLRDLVIGSGLEFEERGARQLKGVPGEWRLFAVAS